tara:strand:- start:210 stop:2819 length:2610 start_codon:yes stop_codon:yes gene_type:complete
MSSHPVWTTPSGAIGTYPSQVAMSFQFVASVTAPGTSITYAKLSGSLPTGLTISTTGLLSGTPAISTKDTAYQFVVRVTDDLGKIADRGFNITVSGVASPTFTTPTGTILSANDSTWIELPIEYSNPVSTNPISIRIVQGQLPPGLEINSNGLIRGYAKPPIINVNFPLITTSAVSTSNSQVTVLSTAGMVVGRTVIFTGTVFGNVEENTTYFVRSIDSSTKFTLSQTKDGPQFALSDGTGDMAVTLLQIQIGQPIVQTYSFTLQLTSVLGDAIESYYIVIANQNAPISEGGPGKPGNSRLPTVFNTRPQTFDVATSDPTNYGYYVFPNDDINQTYAPTVNANIGKITSGEYFSFKMLGYDFDNNALTYRYVDLPLGLVGDPNTGWITGTPVIANNSISNFSFSIDVFKSGFTNIASATFNFGFTVVNNIIGDVTWVTPSALGSINNSTTSVLAVSATSDTEIAYRVTSGELPPSLTLLDNGEIAGIVAYQPTNIILAKDTNTTFNFTIEAYSPLFPVISATRDFSLIVEQKFDQPTDTLYIKCVPSTTDRNLINSLLTNTTLIPTADIYRPTDLNFGKASSVIYEHAYGIYASDFEEYVAAITKNHYWRNIILGQLKTAVARNNAGEIVYEVVYSEIQDNLVNPKGKSVSELVEWPRNIPLNLGPWYTSRTDLYTSYVDRSLVGQNMQTQETIEEQLLVSETNLNLLTEEGQPNYYTSLTPGFARLLYPNSLPNMRTRTGTNIGQEFDFNLLPRWMTSQQANGSTLGYTPAWVISYCKPGTSAQIKTNIETLWVDALGNPYTLNEINFQIDRFTVDKTITYDYDNDVTPPAWTGLPSATPIPNPIDSKDFHVLFPRKTILPDDRNVSG